MISDPINAATASRGGSAMAVPARNKGIQPADD
jgi:hypothetical protein